MSKIIYLGIKTVSKTFDDGNVKTYNFFHFAFPISSDNPDLGYEGRMVGVNKDLVDRVKKLKPLSVIDGDVSTMLVKDNGKKSYSYFLNSING